MYKNRGVTLIELLVVISIIGVLAAVGIPLYNGYLNNARLQEAQIALKTIAAAQENYRLSYGGYATIISDTSSISKASNCVPTELSSQGIETWLLSGVKLNTNFYYFCSYADNTTTTPTFNIKAKKKSSLNTYSINQNGLTSGF